MKKNSTSKNFHQKNKRIDPTWYVHQTIYIDVTETLHTMSLLPKIPCLYHIKVSSLAEDKCPNSFMPNVFAKTVCGILNIVKFICYCLQRVVYLLTTACAVVLFMFSWFQHMFTHLTQKINEISYQNCMRDLDICWKTLFATNVHTIITLYGSIGLKLKTNK